VARAAATLGSEVKSAADGTVGARPAASPSAVGRFAPPSADDAPIWRNRAFMLLWVAQAISQTAQNAIWYGLLVLVETRSQSSTQMSLAILTLLVPSVLFGIVAGAYVDRWDKRAVLIGTNALRAVVTLGYIVFAPEPGGHELHRLGLIYAVNFVFSTIGQFFAPAEAAIIPAIVPRHRLLQANSMFHLTFTTSQLVGIVLLGPLVFKLAGEMGLFGLIAALFAVCALLVWPLPRGSGGPAAEVEQARSLSGLWSDIRELWGFMRRDPLVRLAVGHWTLGATLGLVIAMLAPGFAVSVLGIRAEDSVLVLAPAGVGMVLGTVLLGHLGRSIDKHDLINAGLLVVGAALAALGLLRPAANLLLRASAGFFELPAQAPGPWLTATVMLLALVAGFGFVSVVVASQTIIQERAPGAIRGRVFAVQLVLSNAVSILPLVFLGGVADLIGVGLTLVLLGFGILLVDALTIRAHRRLPLASA